MIGGFPLAFAKGEIGVHAIELATVDDLEAHLDRERLLGDRNYEPPYWALVWSGAKLFLPGFLERHEVRGSRVLDVGCGLGIVSLVLSSAGGEVTAVDRAEAALEFLQQSAGRNRLSIECCAMDLDQLDPGRQFDHVIAAELLYEREGFPGLATSLLGRLGPRGRLTVVDAHRVDTRSFYEALREQGAKCAFSDRLEIREEKTLVRIDVSEFVRRGS